jgi:membrane-associated phospholipid phosphatase
LRELSLQDWCTLAYLAVFPCVLYFRPEHPDKGESLRNYAALFVVYLSAVAAVRSGWLSHRFLRPLAYRSASLLCPVLVYVFFAKYLPLVNDGTYDRVLHKLDMALFGVEPALAFEAWVTPLSTEWFSFFYLAYFPLAYSYFLPILFLVSASRRVNQFTLPVLLVTWIGNIGYVLVPGEGPYASMSERYAAPLPDGFLWGLTQDLVESSGAQLDIFPSLHTALPLALALYSWKLRHQGIHRFWWVTAFFACNIVVATMLLRWHYAVDVLAGALLGVSAHIIGFRLAAWEDRRRTELGLSDVYPPWSPKVESQRGDT